MDLSYNDKIIISAKSTLKKASLYSQQGRGLYKQSKLLQLLLFEAPKVMNEFGYVVSSAVIKSTLGVKF